MNVKMVIYGIVVVCFVMAGLLDLKDGCYKEGTVALVFGLANGLIFFWRP